MRTHALRALGAAGFALIAHLLAVHGDAQMNPTQIAAGVVSGIGFLCGGVIIQRGGSVQGLTTAASLWTTAGVGLAIGGGFYPLGSVLLAAVLTIQFPLRWAEDRLGRSIGSLPPPSPRAVRMQGRGHGWGRGVQNLSPFGSCYASSLRNRCSPSRSQRPCHESGGCVAL